MAFTSEVNSRTTPISGQIVAAGAFEFNRSITVRSQQTIYGTVSTSSDLVYGDLLFSLESNFNGELSLTITTTEETSVPTGYLDMSGMPSWLTIDDNNVSVWYFNGEIAEQKPAGSLPSSNTSQLAIGNLSGSARDQAIFFDYQNSRIFGWDFYSSSNQVTEITFAKPSADASWRFLGCGNLDSTTRDQLLLLKDNQTLGYYYVNSGTSAKWQEIGTLPGGIDSNYEVIGVGKFDGNSTDSLVWKNRKNGIVGLWNFTGTRSFSWQFLGNSQGDLKRELLAVGDFNGDGGADLLWIDRNRGEAIVEIYRANENDTFDVLSALCDRGSLYDGMEFFGVSDLNNDGIDDVMWCDSYSGEISAWLLDDYGRRTATIAVTSTSGL